MRSCLYCDKELVKISQKRFCSKNCASKYIHLDKNSNKYLEIEQKENNRQCYNCNNLLNKQQIKFCSQTCANQCKAIANRKYITCNICNTEKPPMAFSFNIRNDMTSGKKLYCKRCGANNRETKRRNRTWKDDCKQMCFNCAKSRAKRYNIEFTLSKDDIIIPDKCPVLGIPLKREDQKTWYSAPSIDRIDNNKGYTKDNIIVVSRRINILKKDASIDELIKMAEFYKRYNL